VSVLSRLLGRHDDARPHVLVEPMRRKDIPAIQTIEQVSYPRPWSPAVFQSEVELSRRGERYYIVARRGHELVGYAGMMFAVGDAHVTNIAASPAHRQEGIGTRLLAELAWEAIARGSTALTLEVRTSNTGAQTLYRNFGFVPVGVRKNYYENVEDAIVMWCHEVAESAYRDRLAALSPEAVRD
jgi:ribosomal-protein-alanine N-acetyltransferase